MRKKKKKKKKKNLSSLISLPSLTLSASLSNTILHLSRPMLLLLLLLLLLYLPEEGKKRRGGGRGWRGMCLLLLVLVLVLVGKNFGTLELAFVFFEKKTALISCLISFFSLFVWECFFFCEIYGSLKWRDLGRES